LPPVAPYSGRLRPVFARWSAVTVVSVMGQWEWRPKQLVPHYEVPLTWDRDRGTKRSASAGPPSHAAVDHLAHARSRGSPDRLSTVACEHPIWDDFAKGRSTSVVQVTSSANETTAAKSLISVSPPVAIVSPG
jgi:hypothetical protein